MLFVFTYMRNFKRKHKTEDNRAYIHIFPEWNLKKILKLYISCGHFKADFS